MKSEKLYSKKTECRKDSLKKTMGTTGNKHCEEKKRCIKFLIKENQP